MKFFWSTNQIAITGPIAVLRPFKECGYGFGGDLFVFYPSSTCKFSWRPDSAAKPTALSCAGPTSQISDTEPQVRVTAQKSCESSPSLVSTHKRRSMTSQMA